MENAAQKRSIVINVLCVLFVSLPCLVLGYLWRAASGGFKVGMTIHDEHGWVIEVDRRELP